MNRSLSFAFLLSTAVASATLVQENWDYTAADQTTISTANGFNGGSNWTGPGWVTSNTASMFRSGVNLSYTAEGWTNENGSPSGSLIGPVGNANGGDQHRIERAVAGGDLTGTTYLAFLVALPNTNSNLLAVFFSGDADFPGGEIGLGFYRNTGLMRTSATSGGASSPRNSASQVASVGNLISTTNAANPQANLVIVKFETDYNPVGHDRVTIIQNPLDVTTEALAFQTAEAAADGAVYTYDPGEDIWGAGLNPTLAISARTGINGIEPMLDQLRIAHSGTDWETLMAPSGPPPVTPEPGGAEYLDQKLYDAGFDRAGKPPLETPVMYINETETGAPIVIDGVTPAHGLYFKETKVNLTYFLKNEYAGFATDLWRVGATPSFQVVGDGEILFDSGVLLVGERRRVVLDVSHVNQLDLVIADGGDGITNDKMSLGNPRLIKKPVIALNGWEQWRARNFPNALNQSDTLSGPEVRSNGVPNAIRYALGLGPNDSAEASMPKLVGDRLTMVVPTASESEDLIEIWAQVSGDLGPDWTDLPLPATEVIDGEEVRVYQDTETTATAARRFMRLKAVMLNPVARISTDLVSGIAPLTVAFDGSASSAPNSVYRYTWNFGDGTSETLAPSPTHTYSEPGVYEASLEVYDDVDRVGVSRVTITVLSPENQPPTAVADVSSRLITPGNTITFDATGSSDLDGSIVSYVWDFGGGDTATGASVQRTFNSAGFATATLTVTDDDGATATASTRVRIDTGDNSTIFPIREGSRILFIGNSLLGFYGPMRDALTALTGVSTPSFTFEHGGAGKGAGILFEYATWTSLNVEATINQGWDIVIIQPWVDVLDADLSPYETSADTIVGWVRASGAEPVFFSPHTAWEYWPTQQPISRDVIAATAARLGTGLIEVNAAWNQVLADYPMAVDGNNRLVDTVSTDEFKDLLYSDNLHQNANGMALNTYLVYKYLTGKSPVGLSPAWPSGMSGINNALQPYLQGVANTHGTVSPFVSAP